MSHLWTSKDISGEGDWLCPLSPRASTICLSRSGRWLHLVQEEDKISSSTKI
ncbi:hypothetical protein M408DRAFT_333636 [Serendipita vermifera MAFF 305830]|uniref:Uncharacterized protein n=1 Tax=Serendipita vermifera MAFF 305830 TaxID=933852 RepID=A0A0C3AM92_SERVB|nr:hypothetical protein M408DRAFT_333636 [Serendipita vermifera MAFF 305830]